MYDDIQTAVTSDQAGSAFEGMHKTLTFSFEEIDCLLLVD